VSVPRSHALTIDAGLGWTGERRSDRTTRRFATATGALDYRWTIRPEAELRTEAAIFADLESAANWRTASTTALSVGLTSALSLRAAHAIEYRRTPAVGFGRSDMRTSVALAVSIAPRPTPRPP
jgi:putative salt-induced outer membrane protein YdiY